MSYQDPHQQTQQYHVPVVPSAPPSPRRPKALLIAVAAGAVVLLATAGVLVYDRFIAKDPGIALCEALSGGGTVASMASDKDQGYTEDEYRQIRDKIQESRHGDIRNHGTKFIDVGWQVSQLGKDPGLGALAYMGPLMQHMSGLQSACADQGIIVKMPNQP